jgi:hypothetical protein
MDIKILVVDDSKTDIFIIKSILNDYNLLFTNDESKLWKLLKRILI